MSKDIELSNESVGKLLIKYSIPAIIGILVNSLYNVVDHIFIGQIPDIGYLAISYNRCRNYNAYFNDYIRTCNACWNWSNFFNIYSIRAR